jgi:hypothetical protein
MDTMTTTQHLGQAPSRARRCASGVVACSSWGQHTVAPAFHGRFATGLVGSPMNAYLGNTTTLAGAMNETFIKRHARHLGTGST